MNILKVLDNLLTNSFPKRLSWFNFQPSIKKYLGFLSNTGFTKNSLFFFPSHHSVLKLTLKEGKGRGGWEGKTAKKQKLHIIMVAKKKKKRKKKKKWWPYSLQGIPIFSFSMSLHLNPLRWYEWGNQGLF